jgi:dihydrofolate reductase
MDESTTAGTSHRDWTLVVAVANQGVIGRGSDLPWKLSSDLQRFKAMTMGHCLVMGRKTYESIGRPLPGRQTIVLSNSGYISKRNDVAVVADLNRMDAIVEPGRRVMIVGGAQIYAAALPHCQTMWLTRVLADVEGDTYFPTVEWNDWKLDSAEMTAAGPKDEWDTEFQIWHRIPLLP